MAGVAPTGEYILSVRYMPYQNTTEIAATGMYVPIVDIDHKTEYGEIEAPFEVHNRFMTDLRSAKRIGRYHLTKNASSESFHFQLPLNADIRPGDWVHCGLSATGETTRQLEEINITNTKVSYKLKSFTGQTFYVATS